jgi:hypothetical protein
MLNNMNTERVVAENVVVASQPPPLGKGVLLPGKSKLILTKRHYYTRAFGGRKGNYFLIFPVICLEFPLVTET